MTIINTKRLYGILIFRVNHKIFKRTTVLDEAHHCQNMHTHPVIKKTYTKEFDFVLKISLIGYVIRLSGPSVYVTLWRSESESSTSHTDTKAICSQESKIMCVLIWFIR